MQRYSLQRSALDPKYFEIIFDNIVVQEVMVLFPLPKTVPSFASIEEVVLWLKTADMGLAKALAYRLLSMRSYARAGLLEKLKGKGFSDEACLKAIEEVERLGYLSDEEFAHRLIDQKMAKGYGPMYIERFLQSKGLDPKLARQRMDEKKQSQAIQKWALKLKGKEKSKKIGFLLRRGFDYSLVQSL